MKKNRFRLLISLVLTICMTFGVAMPSYSETVLTTGNQTIDINGEYKLADGYAGEITIGGNVTQVAIIGDDDGSVNTNTCITVAARTTSGALEMTIRDLEVTAPANKSGIDFVNAGNRDNKLFFSGECRITGSVGSAGIHVPSGVLVTFDKESSLFEMQTELSVYGGKDGAGIGGSDGETGGGITINSGSITAVGAQGGAGLGGGYSGGGGTVTVNGGVISAVAGSSGAGIGGGNYGYGGTITVNGGEITATGGISGGAGIGSGTNYVLSHVLGGTITINGGKVTARGCNGGAGIGGGFKGTGEKVTINGGEITAISDTGAGIGGGEGEPANGPTYQGSGGMVIVKNNPTVFAFSEQGDLIGNGLNGEKNYGDFTMKNSFNEDLYYFRIQVKNAETNNPVKGVTVTINDGQFSSATNSDGLVSFFVTEDFSYKLAKESYVELTGYEPLTSYQSYSRVYQMEKTADNSASNVTLNILTIDNGDLNSGSGFDETKVVQEVSGLSQSDQMVVSAETVNPAATITLDDIETQGTVTSQTVSLTNGENLIPVIVTSEDGSEEGCYVLSVNGVIDDADLTDLTVDGTSVDGFDRSVTDYSLNVDNSTSSSDIAAVKSDSEALVLYNGTIYDGGEVTVDLDIGANEINFMVIAQDGTDKTYTLTVDRAEGNTGLSGIGISSGTLTAAGPSSYVGTVEQATDTVKLTPVTADSQATYLIKDSEGNVVTGDLDLEIGVNAATVTVTGADGISQTVYDLEITRTLETLSIDQSDLTSGTAGEAYQYDLSATGGIAPYVWTATGLPTGLAIDAATGEIAGTVYTSGEFDVTVTLYEAGGQSTAQAYRLTVHPQPATGKYTITPVASSDYSIGATADGITTMTVNSGVSGFKVFEVAVSSLVAHEGTEDMVFVHTRGGEHLYIGALTADYEVTDMAKAAFNVKAGDVIKVYIVDELTGSASTNATVLQ